MPEGRKREVQTPISGIIHDAAVEVGLDPDQTAVEQAEMHGERLLLTLREQPADNEEVV